MIDINPTQIQGRLGAMDDPAIKQKVIDKAVQGNSSNDTGSPFEQAPGLITRRQQRSER